jgi:ubiquitin
MPPKRKVAMASDDEDNDDGVVLVNKKQNTAAEILAEFVSANLADDVFLNIGQSKRTNPVEESTSGSSSARPADDAVRVAKKTRPLVEFEIEEEVDPGFVPTTKQPTLEPLICAANVTQIDSDASEDEKCEDEIDEILQKEEQLRDSIVLDVLLALNLNDPMVRETIEKGPGGIDWRHMLNVIHTEKVRARKERRDDDWTLPAAYAHSGSVFVQTKKDSAGAEGAEGAAGGGAAGGGAAGGEKDDVPPEGNHPTDDVTVRCRIIQLNGIGINTTFQVKSGDTIDMVKTKIHDQQGIPPDEQRLFFKKKTLENDRTLDTYGIRHKSKILCVVQKKIGDVIAAVFRKLIQDPTISMQTAQDAGQMVQGQNLKKGIGILWDAFKTIHHVEAPDSDEENEEAPDSDEENEEERFDWRGHQQDSLPFWDGLNQQQVCDSFRDGGFGAEIDSEGVLKKTPNMLKSVSTGEENKLLVQKLRQAQTDTLSITHEDDFEPMTIVVNELDKETGNACYQIWAVAKSTNMAKRLVAHRVYCTETVTRDDIDRLLTDEQQAATTANPYGLRFMQRPVFKPEKLTGCWKGDPRAKELVETKSVGRLFLTDQLEGVKDILDSLPHEKKVDNDNFNVEDAVSTTNGNTQNITINDCNDREMIEWMEKMLTEKAAAKQTRTYKEEAKEKRTKTTKVAGVSDDESGGENDEESLKKESGKKDMRTLISFPLFTADKKTQVGTVYGIHYKGTLKTGITNVDMVFEINTKYVTNADSTCELECFEFNEDDASEPPSASASSASSSGNDSSSSEEASSCESDISSCS